MAFSMICFDCLFFWNNIKHYALFNNSVKRSIGHRSNWLGYKTIVGQEIQMNQIALACFTIFINGSR